MDLEKGAFSALNILIVIWPAVFLYEMMEFAGVFQSIKQMLQKKTQDELVMVLLICWLFSKNLFLFGFLVKKEEICSNRDYKTCCYTSPLLQKAWGTLNPCIRREWIRIIYFYANVSCIKKFLELKCSSQYFVRKKDFDLPQARESVYFAAQTRIQLLCYLPIKNPI